ncbi:MAG: hypothetical protein WA364_28570 [Candidatus Nitrosopolaris sp.]
MPDLENQSGIQVITAKGKLNEIGNGAVPTAFKITVPANTQIAEYTIPILATISSNSTCAGVYWRRKLSVKTPKRKFHKHDNRLNCQAIRTH